jgi:hypothetical protein
MTDSGFKPVFGSKGPSSKDIVVFTKEEYDSIFTNVLKKII